jgi:hypothetical protein
MTTAERRVQVEARSAQAELGHVVRAGMAIVVGVWIYVAWSGSAATDGPAGQRNLLPFQALVQDRPLIEQRVFTELQEGLLEAEARRATTGAWPTVAALAADGIPPFASDPTARGAAYDWRLIQNGTLVNYLGVPRSEAPAWLVLVQEPEPGAPPDPAREDEEHHRLTNGPMLHVSTWTHAKGDTIGAAVIRLPQADGWTQLYAVGPSAAVLPRR